ncbi:MAG: HAD hydrolase family protein [Actinomycetota bacterium]
MVGNQRGRGLIAIDLDGTLLGPSGELSDRNAEAVHAAADAGWYVVLASGRPPHLVTHLADRIAGAVTHVVGGNGSIVSTFPGTADGDTTLLHLASFDVATARAIVRHLRTVDPGLRFALATDAGFGHERGFAERMPAAVHDDPIDDVLTLGGDAVFKLLVFHDEHSVDDLTRSLPPHLADALDASDDATVNGTEFAVTHMGADAAEIGPAAVDKCAGLRWLCEHLGVAQADVVAIGDEGNDLTMLTWAGTGWAMANAPHHVRAAADHVAPHHAEDGVAQVLEALR